MEIVVTKLTDIDLLRKAASYTTGHDCKMSLATAYKLRHSLIRSQLFVIEMLDIPLFCASQFVRSWVGTQWYQLTKRTDRGGKNFKVECSELAMHMVEAYHNHDDKKMSDCIDIVADKLPNEYDRYAPTNLMCITNAEAIINLSHKRLCRKASAETMEITHLICEAVKEVDPDLYPHLVPACIAHGGICHEQCCGFIKTDLAQKWLNDYKKLFSK